MQALLVPYDDLIHAQPQYIMDFHVLARTGNLREGDHKVEVLVP
jgi:hypothetical protein